MRFGKREERVAETVQKTDALTPAVRSVDDTTKLELLTKVQRFEKELRQNFVGRDQEAHVVALAVLAEQHAVLIGAPGTAKSSMIRYAAQLLDAHWFNTLMSQYVEKSDIFGNIDVLAMRNGEYKYSTNGRLTEAEIAFLDEFFNAKSILSTLNTAMEERDVRLGAETRHLPIHSIFAATNVVPEDPSEDAVYDRFMLRCNVKPVPEYMLPELLEKSWAQKAAARAMTQQAVQPILTINEIDLLHNMIFDMNLAPIRPRLIDLIVKLGESGMHLSDRRIIRTQEIIAASALLGGRTTPTEADLLVLKYIAPSQKEDFEKVEVLLNQEIKTLATTISELKGMYDNITKVRAELDKKGIDSLRPRLMEINDQLNRYRERLTELSARIEDQAVRDLTSKIELELAKINKKISKGIGAD